MAGGRKAGQFGIKSVQRGTVAVTSGNSTGTATVTQVDPNKAELHFLGSEAYSGGNILPIRITLTNGTTVTANRYSSVTTGTTTASFELVEYF